MSSINPRLFYVHDPMCSWCWGFSKTWLEIKQQLPDSIELITLVGGLAPDSQQPMAESMQSFLQQTWHRIQQQIPGTEFNFDFWTQNTPRRSTYPACRAVIAAKKLAGKQDAMTSGIQQAYYLHAKNPSDLDTLTDVAVQIGLNSTDFKALMDSEQIHDLLDAELTQGRNMGLNSFPSLALQIDNELHAITLDYNSSQNMLHQINSLLQSS